MLLARSAPRLGSRCCCSCCRGCRCSCGWGHEQLLVLELLLLLQLLDLLL